MFPTIDRDPVRQHAPIPVVTNDDLRRWQNRMGYTYERAAEAMGVNRSSYARWLKGASPSAQKPTLLPQTVMLAAMAIECGLDKYIPQSKIRSKIRKPVAGNDDAGGECA